MTNEENDQTFAFEELKARRRRTYLGLIGGVVLGLGLGKFIPVVRERIDAFSMILWSGALGIMTANLGQFEKAGAILTRSENRGLNFLVGLGAPAVFLVLVYVVTNRFF